MSTSEPDERTPLPLAEAAACLGITPDALRMRLRRGKVEGFKRDGHLFIYLPATPAGEQRRAAAGPTEQRPNRAAAARGGGAPAPDAGPMSVVVEFQKVELDRLLKENVRLNERLDQQLEEVRQLRHMLQREQVLRQQEHNLRQHVQHILDRLTERFALPPPRVEAAPAEVEEAEEAAAEAAAAVEPAAPEEEPAPAGAAAPSEPSPLVLRAWGEQAEPTPPAAPAPDAVSAAARDEDAEAAGLAEMLREIGQSLRETEASAAAPEEAAFHAEPRGDADDASGDLWDQDRRNAARAMKKLFRTRQTPRPRDS